VRNATRFALLFVASLLFVGLGLSRLAPRASTAAQAARQKAAPAGRKDAAAKAARAEPSVALSSLRGTLSLFNWGPGFYGVSTCGTPCDFVPPPDGSKITTYNLHAGLERLIRYPRQNGTFSHSKPRLSPDGTKIVYAEMGEDGYNLDVYVMNADGTGAVNLTNNPSDPTDVYNCRIDPHGRQTPVANIFLCMDTEPAWSPDGQHIAFVSGRGGSRQLYVMEADGSELTLLETRGPAYAGGGAFEPVWSPDGTKIAYSLNQYEIALLALNRVEGADGKVTYSVEEDETLVPGPGGFTLIDDPAWSPDGSKVAYTHQSIDFANSRLVWEVYTIRADGTGETRVTDTADELEHNPVWSPDGTKIAYSAWKPDGDDFYTDGRLFIHDLNTRTRARIETRGPNTDVFSWVDPCNAPAPNAPAPNAAANSAAAKSTESKSAALKSTAAKSGGARPAASKQERTGATPSTTFKCIQEIVVNITTDEPDTNTADEFCDTDEDEIGNQCSLRAAIQEANARPGIDLITFDIPGTGLHTITPTSELPDINEQVAIDATTQPGYAEGAPTVELSGAAAGAANGFNVKAGGVRISGFIINRFAKNGVGFKGNGIFAGDTSALRVQSCFIGTDAAGTTAAPNEDSGVALFNTTDSTVGGYGATNGNLISGNAIGVAIIGTAAEGTRGGNEVVGNRIGVDRTGANVLANQTAGIGIVLSTHNQIGDKTDATGTAPGNVVAGGTDGASVIMTGAGQNAVAGNLIGTDATGTKGFGSKFGVYLTSGSTKNTVGGYPASARNVISGNRVGVDLFGADVNENYVLGNYIGTDATGQAVVPVAGVADLPQQLAGILVEGGSRNLIGRSPNEGIRGNVVAGNASVQISVQFAEATDNELVGNYVGLFADGQTSPTYHPQTLGLSIIGATRTVVGGGGNGIANVISGNGIGVLIGNPANHLNAQNQLLYNYIGTNAAGTAARPNASGGVIIAKSSNNLVEGNVISGNGGTGGVFMANEEPPQAPSPSAASFKSFAAAYPASASKTSAAPSPLADAVALLRQAAASTALPAKGGFVAQAEQPAAETKNNVLTYNYIGTSADGMTMIPNEVGVTIGFGANENSIGQPDSGNYISGNNKHGVLILTTAQGQAVPAGNRVQGNVIGLTGDETAKLPNGGRGVAVLFGNGTIIGGDTEDAGNVISGNGSDGVAIDATSNTVRFNLIGTNRAGASGLGNARDGIRLENVSEVENTIADNQIAGNGGVGINVSGVAQAPQQQQRQRASKAAGVRPSIGGGINKILTKIGGNSIGVVRVINGQNTGLVKLANAFGGVKISDIINVAVTSRVGGGPNVIAGNGGPGVLIEGQGATGNVVEGAIIGTDEQGSSGLGNAGDGVRIVNAPGNFIGGENKPGEAGRGNTIAGNAGNGIAVEGGAAAGNAVQGNAIGVVGANGTTVKRGNGFLGIKIDGAVGTLIGLPGLGGLVKEHFGNLVGGNAVGGILLQAASATRVSGNALGTDHAGTNDLGNGGPGILMTTGTSGTTVGGPEENSGNTITNNDGAGVRIDETGGTGNLVDPNSIYNNRGLGIDIARRGVTVNDFGDADEGPNRLQNYPEIVGVAANDAGQLVVSYRLTSSPQHSSYGQLGIYVEFFKADQRGQGRKFLGFDRYTEADFNTGAPAVKQINLGALASHEIEADDPITATASDAGNNTSEFSPPYSTRSLVVTNTDDDNDGTCDADCSLREALAAADAGNTITFASPLFDSARTITLNGAELVVDKSVTVAGPGANLLTVSADDRSRVFNVSEGVIATIRGLTLTKGDALGGFIGGGVLNAGTLTLAESHVKDNVADRGAGVYNTGSLIVRASAVSGNKANLGSATPAAGGIQSGGGGSLEVVNSTVSGNEATASDAAGGIYVVDGTANITAGTVAFNSAPQGASSAGGVKNRDGSVTMANTIVAANSAAFADLSGAFTSQGYNLVGNNAGAAESFPAGAPNANKDTVGTSQAVDPLLDQLGDYGGTTPTHRLQPGSPAIDRGKAFGLSTDQRGEPRPSDDQNVANADGGDGSDVGAFEAQAAPVATASVGGRVTLDGSGLGGVTVTLTRPGGPTETAVTDASGYYLLSDLPAGSYAVAPARPGFSFTPASRDVSLAGADVTDADFAAASAAPNPRPAGGPVIISEFRFSGATSDDEFVELYNGTDADIDISGYRLEALSGQSVTIPAATVLPARSHYLITRLPAEGAGYTLSAYAAPDLTYDAFELPEAGGLALFDAAGAVSDAVGTGTTPLPFREGNALAAAAAAGQHSFVRSSAGGHPADTGDNASDFILVATDPQSAGAGARLGAPAPQNSASPVVRNGPVKPSLVDPCAPAGAEPNTVRDSSFSDPLNNSTHGTFAIRRRFTNMTGANVTRLRFRIVATSAMTASGAPPAGTADLRALTGPTRPAVTIAGAGCTGAQQVAIEGLTLEELTADNRPSQPKGGAWNSTLAAGTIKLDAPLGPGHSRNFEFLLGVEQPGSYRFFVNVEAATDAPPTPARKSGAPTKKGARRRN
jgi:CSLREA domain-containing protein